MHNTSIQVEFGEIDGSYTYPGSVDGVDQQLGNYVSFRQGTYMSYSTNDGDLQAFQEMMSKAAHHVQQELSTDVLRTRNDYQSILELATR